MMNKKLLVLLTPLALGVNIESSAAEQAQPEQQNAPGEQANQEQQNQAINDAFGTDMPGGREQQPQPPVDQNGIPIPPPIPAVPGATTPLSSTQATASVVSAPEAQAGTDGTAQAGAQQQDGNALLNGLFGSGSPVVSPTNQNEGVPTEAPAQNAPVQPVAQNAVVQEGTQQPQASSAETASVPVPPAVPLPEVPVVATPSPNVSAENTAIPEPPAQPIPSNVPSEVLPQTPVVNQAPNMAAQENVLLTPPQAEPSLNPLPASNAETASIPVPPAVTLPEVPVVTTPPQNVSTENVAIPEAPAQSVPGNVSPEVLPQTSVANQAPNMAAQENILPTPPQAEPSLSSSVASNAETPSVPVPPAVTLPEVPVVTTPSQNVGAENVTTPAVSAQPILTNAVPGTPLQSAENTNAASAATSSVIPSSAPVASNATPQSTETAPGTVAGNAAGAMGTPVSGANTTALTPAITTSNEGGVPPVQQPTTMGTAIPGASEQTQSQIEAIPQQNLGIPLPSQPNSGQVALGQVASVPTAQTDAEAAKETASNFIATQAQSKLEKGDGQVDAELKKDVKDMKENVEDIKEVKDDVASIKETLNLLTIALNEKNGVLDDKSDETKSLGDTEEVQKSVNNSDSEKATVETVSEASSEDAAEVKSSSDKAETDTTEQPKKEIKEKSKDAEVSNVEGKSEEEVSDKKIQDAEKTQGENSVKEVADKSENQLDKSVDEREAKKSENVTKEDNKEKSEGEAVVSQKEKVNAEKEEKKLTEKDADIEVPSDKSDKTADSEKTDGAKKVEVNQDTLNKILEKVEKIEKDTERNNINVDKKLEILDDKIDDLDKDNALQNSTNKPKIGAMSNETLPTEGSVPTAQEHVEATIPSGEEVTQKLLVNDKVKGEPLQNIGMRGVVMNAVPQSSVVPQTNSEAIVTPNEEQIKSTNVKSDVMIAPEITTSATNVEMPVATAVPVNDQMPFVSQQVQPVVSAGEAKPEIQVQNPVNTPISVPSDTFATTPTNELAVTPIAPSNEKGVAIEQQSASTENIVAEQKAEGINQPVPAVLNAEAKPAEVIKSEILRQQVPEAMQTTVVENGTKTEPVVAVNGEQGNGAQLQSKVVTEVKEEKITEEPKKDTVNEQSSEKADNVSAGSVKATKEVKSEVPDVSAGKQEVGVESSKDASESVTEKTSIEGANKTKAAEDKNVKTEPEVKQSEQASSQDVKKEGVSSTSASEKSLPNSNELTEARSVSDFTPVTVAMNTSDDLQSLTTLSEQLAATAKVIEKVNLGLAEQQK